jgi:hypothetical protein
MVSLCSVVTVTVNQKTLYLRALPPFSLSFVSQPALGLSELFASLARRFTVSCSE